MNLCSFPSLFTYAPCQRREIFQYLFKMCKNEVRVGCHVLQESCYCIKSRTEPSSLPWTMYLNIDTQKYLTQFWGTCGSNTPIFRTRKTKPLPRFGGWNIFLLRDRVPFEFRSDRRMLCRAKPSFICFVESAPEAYFIYISRFVFKVSGKWSFRMHYSWKHDVRGKHFQII